MKASRSFAAVSLAAVLAGCASGPPFIDVMQPEAVNMAARRAQFELNCPSVNTTILSRETLQPISFNFGILRAEYTIGAEGCGRRATYIVICPDNGSGCYAGAGRTEIQ